MATTSSPDGPAAGGADAGAAGAGAAGAGAGAAGAGAAGADAGAAGAGSALLHATANKITKLPISMKNRLSRILTNPTMLVPFILIALALGLLAASLNFST